MSLVTPETVRKLRTTLHAKAKGEASYRFYSLYDKIYRKDVLYHAYRCCKANGGAAGVDGQTFDQIEAAGRNQWLNSLMEDLRKKTYQPDPIRRVYIPKANGEKRPLGIGTIRDRVVQMAVVIVLNPIFEADLMDEQYGYRENRNAHDAVRKIHGLLYGGFREVIDADLEAYFDSIPHYELMKCLTRRISDGRLLKMIKRWLQSPVQEPNARGYAVYTNQARSTKHGTPQGSPLSPLLSNVYMRRLILGWKKLGFEDKLQAKIVSYADDFVICCRKGRGREAMLRMRAIVEGIKLKVNEDKTRLTDISDGPFDFLGYTIGFCHSKESGKRFIGTWPSKTKVKLATAKIRDLTRRHTEDLPVEVQVARLNRFLAGWSNYFMLGKVSPAYKILDRQCYERLRQWLRRKHKLHVQGFARFPSAYVYDTLGLIRLERKTRSFPWAKA